MNAHPSLDTRVRMLESSLRQTRRLAWGLALILIVVASAAFVADDDEIRTKKLALLQTNGQPGVVLISGSQGNLIIQTPDGQEVMTLGGNPMRPVREDHH